MTSRPATDGTERAARTRARRLHQVRRLRWVLVQIPFIAVIALVVIAAVFLIFDRWRRGAFVFGSAALLAALLRALLPSSRVGLLEVRGRFVDVMAMTVAGLAILWLATSIDPLGTD
jgi:predicted ABC-type sugar transport system permease subunit